MQKRGIDHVIVMVRDMDGAVVNYRNLGFTITPRMYHPFGTANNLIMFRSSFLELLGVVDRAQLHGIGRLLSDLLENKEGVSHFALQTTDAVADREEFLAKGLRPSAVSDFVRPVELPDGTKTQAEVSVCTLDYEQTPRVMLFVSQQHVASAVWVPRWQEHPNGALDIASITIVADRPREQFAHLFSQLFGPQSVTAEDTRVLARTSSGLIEVVTVERYRQRFSGARVEIEPVLPYIAATTIDVADLKRFASCAVQGGFRPASLDNGSWWIEPQVVNGIGLEFRQAR
jgi:hypothetical protein